MESIWKWNAVEIGTFDSQVAISSVPQWIKSCDIVYAVSYFNLTKLLVWIQSRYNFSWFDFRKYHEWHTMNWCWNLVVCGLIPVNFTHIFQGCLTGFGHNWQWSCRMIIDDGLMIVGQQITAQYHIIWYYNRYTIIVLLKWHQNELYCTLNMIGSTSFAKAWSTAYDKKQMLKIRKNIFQWLIWIGSL